MPNDSYEVIVIDARDAGQVNEEGQPRDRQLVGTAGTLWLAFDILERHLGPHVIYWAIERGGEVVDEGRPK